MKGTIIEFKKEVIEVNRPWFQRIIREPIRDFREATSPLADYGEGRQIFEVIQFSYLDKNKERVEENYFVNYEDMKLAMPIVEGMVQARTRELRRQLDDNRENSQRYIDSLQQQLNKARKFWLYRFWYWSKKQWIKLSRKFEINHL